MFWVYDIAVNYVVPILIIVVVWFLFCLLFKKWITNKWILATVSLIVAILFLFIIQHFLLTPYACSETCTQCSVLDPCDVCDTDCSFFYLETYLKYKIFWYPQLSELLLN